VILLSTLEMEGNMIKLSTIIKELRLQKDYPQVYVAEKLGVSRPTYIQLESGAREPNFSELNKLAECFEVPVSTFFGQGKEVTVELEKEPETSLQPEERISVPRDQINKFREVLLYVLDKTGAKPHIGETVIYKLLYFIDFDYYEKFEDQLIGAKYIKNHHGPTPVAFHKIVKEMELNKEIERVKSKYFQYEQKKYLPVRKPNLKILSAQEIKHIDEVIARLGDKNATELSQLSHKDVPWITTDDGKPIDYEAVFYRTKDTSVRSYDPDED
jgi:transcriptional regulator with XRE-family HTH domain